MSGATKFASDFWHGEQSKSKLFMQMHKYDRILRDNCDLAKRIEREYGGVSLQFVAFGGEKKGRPDVGFFVNRTEPGVFLLRIAETQGALHAVCVDNRSAPGMIFDCVEREALELSSEALKLCVGSGAVLKGIDDVRRVVVHNSKLDGSSKKRGRSKSERRAKRARIE